MARPESGDTGPTREDSTFDDLARRYDAWYDSPRGARIFELERDCLAPLLSDARHPRLEIGVGSGRFARALQLEVGVDTAAQSLALAQRRGIHVVRADGQHLPFAGGCFGAIAIVMTLCFVEDPSALLHEARRTLARGAPLVLGTVPLDSAWGASYQEMGRSGHDFYRNAHFTTLDELVAMLGNEGFAVTARRSTLLGGPTSDLDDESVHEGSVTGAGFVALAAVAAQ